MCPKFPKPPSAKGLRRRALDGLRLGVYGAGRVGTSLARWCADAGAELRLVASRRPALPSVLAGVGTPRAVRPEDVDLRRAPIDVLLLTVSDPALDQCARRLAEPLPGIEEDEDEQATGFPVVLHVSGCRDASALAPLAEAGVPVGSVHPLRAFAGFAESPDPRTVYAVDGAPDALLLARRLVDAWSGRSVELGGDRRAVYHLAASLAAGGVTTVVAMVAELTERADLEPELAEALFAGYLSLLRGAVDGVEDAVRRGGPGAAATAITGPAARGDGDTLERHRRALRSLAPELAPTLGVLWRETARQVARSDDGESDEQERGDAGGAVVKAADRVDPPRGAC